MSTQHYYNRTYIGPDDRPATHYKHLRGAYKAAGLEVPAALTETVDDALRAYARKFEGQGQALLVQAVENGDPALAEEAARAFADGAAYRAGAEKAVQALVTTKVYALPLLRERAAQDLDGALQAAAKRLGELAQEFDPVATRSLHPGVLGEQRQYAGLKVLGEVEQTLATLGALTVVPRPPDPTRVRSPYAHVHYPSQLVVEATYAEGADQDRTASPVWLSMERGLRVWDNDIHLLAMAGQWEEHADVRWRLFSGD